MTPRLETVVTPERFREWLTYQQEFNEDAGQANDQDGCPIANFVSEAMAESAFVYADKRADPPKFHVGTDHDDIDAPDWVNAFVHLVDGDERVITATEALAILDQVTA